MKEKIVQCAYQLFHTLGIKRVSMDDIAKTVGVSKKTIYQCFRSKEAVVEAVVDDKIAKDEQFLKEQLSDDISQKNEVIEELIQLNNYFGEEVKNMNPSLIFDMEMIYPKIFDRINQYHQDVFEKIFKKNLEKGMALGVYRRTIDPEVMAKLWHTNIHLYKDQKFNAKKGLHYLNMAIFDHMMHGLIDQSNPKNLEAYQNIIDKHNV